jgi:hypothetical protein
MNHFAFRNIAPHQAHHVQISPKRVRRQATPTLTFAETTRQMMFLFVLLSSWSLTVAAQNSTDNLEISYTDQNNNRYLAASGRLTYQPITAAASSSGTYSGGEPAEVPLAEEAFTQLLQLSQVLLQLTEHQTDRRQMTTSVLGIRLNGDQEQVLLYPCAERSELEALLQVLLAPKNQSPQPIEIVAGQKVQYKGRLEDGQLIADLSWAWQSSVACFPAIRQEHFNGSHVFFTGVIPARTEIIVRLIPDDPKAEMSLYGFLTGVDNEPLPPNLTSCIRCEADHDRGRPVAGRPNRGNTRVLQQMLAIQRPYRVTIGVAGAQGLQSGGFTLEIDASPR